MAIDLLRHRQGDGWVDIVDWRGVVGAGVVVVVVVVFIKCEWKVGLGFV